jgi:hypothetical protein
MDRNADLGERLDDAAVGKNPRTETLEDGAGEGEGGSPQLTLGGFSGPLDHLLTRPSPGAGKNRRHGASALA